MHRSVRQASAVDASVMHKPKKGRATGNCLWHMHMRTYRQCMPTPFSGVCAHRHMPVRISTLVSIQMFIRFGGRANSDGACRTCCSHPGFVEVPFVLNRVILRVPVCLRPESFP